MLRRAIFLFSIMSAPAAAFSLAYSRPLFLLSLLPAALATLWVVSPVTYPTWLVRGLKVALPFSVLLPLALWILRSVL
jgi:hypothetical protein